MSVQGVVEAVKGGIAHITGTNTTYGHEDTTATRAEPHQEAAHPATSDVRDREGQGLQSGNGVPSQVLSSQREARWEPEAAGSAEAVREKSEFENELKSKVPEADSSAESGRNERKDHAFFVGEPDKCLTSNDSPSVPATEASRSTGGNDRLAGGSSQQGMAASETGRGHVSFSTQGDSIDDATGGIQGPAKDSSEINTGSAEQAKSAPTHEKETSASKGRSSMENPSSIPTAGGERLGEKHWGESKKIDT